MTEALLFVRLALAAVFALAAVTKLADLPGSRAAVAGFGVPERLAEPLGVLLPLVELGIAVALLPAGTARAGAFAACAILVVFAVAIARSMARGEAPDCHCFGQVHSQPAGWRTLARDIGLACLAAFVALAGGEAPSATAWIGRLSDAGVVAFAGGVALAAVAALTAWALLALLRQNGRLLLRIDELEARLDASAAPPAAPAGQGLPIGIPAPAFTLAGLYGESVTLESLTSAESPVLLLFTDPDCGPCNALLPQISTWQHEYGERLTVAVLTRGSVEDNRAKAREHGITNVWLDDRLTVSGAYAVGATPGGVLIDVRGRIASGVVAGADAITALVEAAVADPGPRRPVAVGAPSPTLELDDLFGRPLALSAPDRDTLILFWNPGCGFCQRMLDDVRELERGAADRALRLLVISTGSVADNAAMGLESPIALDSAFGAGETFGATGTPSAILVDREGRIASGLAVGAAEVLALAMSRSEGTR